MNTRGMNHHFRAVQKGYLSTSTIWHIMNFVPYSVQRFLKNLLHLQLSECVDNLHTMCFEHPQLEVTYIDTYNAQLVFLCPL